MKDLGTEASFRDMLQALFLRREEKHLDYQSFIQSKQHRVLPIGFDIGEEELHPSLFDFQRKLCRWEIHRGRAAIFAGTGLGKTRIQLEWARSPC